MPTPWWLMLFLRMFVVVPLEDCDGLKDVEAPSKAFGFEVVS